MHKKVVIFWGKPKSIKGDNNPLKKIGRKLPVYMEFMDELLNNSLEVYLSFGYENYLGGLSFKSSAQYTEKGFRDIRQTITANAVYDRSAKVTFPDNSKEADGGVVNCSSFKVFSNNKWQFYQDFKKYCPETQLANNRNELRDILRLKGSRRVVVKPINKFGGKGIIIDSADNINAEKVVLEGPVVVQRFLDTSEGVEGLVNGIHDLRVVMVGSKPVWATIRKPAKDSLVANVALGGEIVEIPVDKLPETIKPILKDIDEVFVNKYNDPLYSVDFGFESNKPYVFEINDQIGFPGPDMVENDFLASLVHLLKSKC